MAKKKASAKSQKEVEYVASGLNINYSIPVGLTSMLASATKTNNKEVWCKLSDIANICAARLVNRLGSKSSHRHNSYADSWTTQTFPGSNIKLRLDMSGSISTSRWDQTTKMYVETEPKMTFRCRVKVSGSTTESFTQQQINDYITDKILLGDDEEFCGTPEDETEQI